jgi:hypothetical protein
MKICQIEHDKTEGIREINENFNLDSSGIFPVQFRLF